MFTGIIEEQGTVVSVVRSGQSLRLSIECRETGNDLAGGQSIAVDGVCLTVAEVSRRQGICIFSADVMPETFRNTTIPSVHRGSRVNLERAVRIDGRFGGHIVTGHIDGTGRITSMLKDGNEISCTITVPVPVLDGIVNKGSVTVDGISLTVTAVEYINGQEGKFTVGVIPHTRQITGMSGKTTGCIVNIECDIIGKYVNRYVSGIQNDKKRTGASEWVERYLLQ
ncbi:MAG: riboflavin synthase, partial [Treponema sp.]|nr:riboflavin synthase [Treponema sp.]